jgi:hypothetical protein
MISDRAQARDEILALVHTVADAQTPDVLVVYDDVQEDKPSGTASWLRAVVRHNAGTRCTLGPGGRHTQSGILFVQIFTPAGEGLAANDTLATALEAVFRGQSTDGGVVFRDVVTREIGQDGPWFQSNLYVDFEYDLVGA